MKVRISDRIARKLKEKHGLEWDDVSTIFDDDESRVDLRKGDTGISFGITETGAAVTAITVRKGNTRWLKTARPMTGAEKRIFRKHRS